MKIQHFIACFLLISLIATSQNNTKNIIVGKDIELIKLSDNAYIHTSYSFLEQFGRFSSNGLIYINNGNAILFDSPVTDSLTKELVQFINDSIHVKIISFVPNHWHGDCMGGLRYIKSIGIDSYANQVTIDIAKEKGLPLPSHGFKDSIELKVGNVSVYCYYLGAAHSIDNIVVWIPSEKILFPGCICKDVAAKNLGNTIDGDVNAYPVTLSKIISKFPEAKFVVPGHGNYGGNELLHHTLKLSKQPIK